MQQDRKNAYRHVRPVHYHHCSPSRSFRVEKRAFFTKHTYPESPQYVEVVVKKGLFGKKTKKLVLKTKTTGKGKTGKKKKKKHGKHYALKKFLAKLVIVGFIIWAILKYVFVVMILYGNYMFPAVRDGDLVIAYKLQSAITNDIVVYSHDGETRIGRVVAKENAIIRFDSETETYSINGVTPTEEIFYTTTQADDADIEYPYTVPAGCVYILNDHRDDKTDSRTYEAVRTSDIQGVVVFVIRRRGF